MLFPRVHSFDDDVRAEAQVVQAGVTGGCGDSREALAAMNRDLARLAVLVAGRVTVPDELEWQPLRMRRKRVFIELQHEVRHGIGQTLAPAGVERVLNEEHPAQADTQPLCLVIEPELETREAGRVRERDKLMLLAPRRIRRRRVGEAESQDAVAGDPALGQRRQYLTRFGRKPFYGVAIKRDDARHAW